MAASYSNVTQSGLFSQQYPPALLPKPGKDNARLQKLLKKSAKKKAAPQTTQTPAPFRSSLSPVNEASADLERSEHSTPPKTPESPLFASQPPRFNVRPLYQHVASPYPQHRGIPHGKTSLFSPQPFSAPANVHPPYFYTAPIQHPQYVYSPPAQLGALMVPGSVTQAVTTLTPGSTSSVSKITMPAAETRTAAPIPVVETVSHTILKSTTVISPLIKSRSPRPTFKATISRSPKPMFEVPQIQMYTANTYEVIKTPLHDSTGLSAIGGTTTQRRTPTSEIRRGLTPTSEVKRVLTPTSEVKRVLTPTSEIKRVLTPTSEVKRVLTPTSEVKQVLTPTSEVKKSVTPTSDVKRVLTPTSEILRPKTPTYDSPPSRTFLGRPKTPSYHVTRSNTPVFEISRPNPLLFAVSPITTETQRSKPPTPVSPTTETQRSKPPTPVSPTTETQRSKPPTPVSPTTETEQSKELLNAKSAATPNGVISLHENVSKPDAPRPEAIDIVKSARPKSPTAPLGYQRPKTPTNVSPKPTLTSIGYQRPRTPSYESPVAPTYGYQRPKTPSYEGPKPPSPATQMSKTPSYEPARPAVQSLRNQRPKTPIYGTSPQVSHLAFQRPKTPTYVTPQSKSTYYGLTPAEYAAHGGIKSHTPSFGLSGSKTPTQEESKSTAHALEASDSAQLETLGKTQALAGETHKENGTILKQEVTATPVMMVPTIVVSQASDVPSVSSHEPLPVETPRVQLVSQETPKVSVPEAETPEIKTPAKQTEGSPVPDASKTSVNGVKPSAPPPATTAKDAKKTVEKVTGTVTKMVESISTTSTTIEKDSSKAVTEGPETIKKMDTDHDKVKPEPIKKMDTDQDKVKPEPIKKVDTDQEKVKPGPIKKMDTDQDKVKPEPIKKMDTDQDKVKPEPIKKKDTDQDKVKPEPIKKKDTDQDKVKPEPIKKKDTDQDKVKPEPIKKDTGQDKVKPEPIKKKDTDQDEVKPDPALVPSATPSSVSETKDTGNDLPAAEPLLKVIQKPKGMKSKLSGWSRLKKHMVVEVEEPKFPQMESKIEAKKEDEPKISETRENDQTAVKASERSGSEEGDKNEPSKPKTLQMWDAVLFQMFSTKENIMQQIEASRREDEKEDSTDVVKEVPAFAHRLPVLLFSPRFDAKRLREAASRPLTKISTVFEMGLIGRKNKEEEPKDFNRTARGFAAS